MQCEAETEAVSKGDAGVWEFDFLFRTCILY